MHVCCLILKKYEYEYEYVSYPFTTLCLAQNDFLQQPQTRNHIRMFRNTPYYDRPLKFLYDI